MKKNKYFFLALLIFVCIALLFAACGRNRNNDNEVDENKYERNNGWAGGGLHLTGGTHTLTVSVPLAQEPQFRRAGENLQVALASEGVILDFRIDYFTNDNWEEHFALLLSQFAAGAGPDIISGGFFPLPFYRFVENGFLADIYELIDQSPVTDRGDFFMNALEPLEIGGRLYTFPMQFGFDFVGINANAPAAFVERFAALESATPTDLMQIYFDLINEHPEWGEFAFIYGLGAHSMFAPEIARAVDFANGTTAFTDPRTERMIENMRRAYEDNYRFETSPVFPVTEEFLAELGSRYLFATPPIGNELEAFLDFTTPFFVHYTPLADTGGRLVQRGFSGTNISASKNADPALAWAFIEQLISAAATEEFRIVPDIPIARHYLQGALENSFHRIFRQSAPRPFWGSQHDAIAQAITRLEAYSTKPTAYRMIFTLYPVPIGAFFDFLAGDATAMATLRMLETEIPEWLNEERPPIGEYTPVEAVPIFDPELPTQTLTIHTSNIHTRVLRHAAEVMNASWRARGVPYNFSVEIDDYDWTDWPDPGARITRLQTQLMAGQGPDIFTLSPGYNLHAFAGTGFLADIYSLMDADPGRMGEQLPQGATSPQTNRDDFFMQALSAFEIAGGLYVFPTSFGFEYVAINASLPQSVIERFLQHESISLTQMFEIYLYLMDNYGDEFGHLIFATSTGFGEPIYMVETAAAGFIDFNARTANLTDPRFITFLEYFARAADGRALIERVNVGGIGPERFLLRQAQRSVFLMESGQATTFHAYFTPVTPIFTHYIPHVDEQGRLLLTDVRNRLLNYGAFCITAAGNLALAWEFLQYVVQAYSQPVGRAGLDPIFGARIWGNRYLASPIRRELFEGHTRLTIEWVFEWIDDEAAFGDMPQVFVGVEEPAERERQIANAITRMAHRNEQPMQMMSPMLPLNLFQDDFELFMLGVITPQAFAQRMQNSITLWLIE